ncbi:MAG: hypothetical protein ABWY07_10195 [Burkholderiales bacterium]
MSEDNMARGPSEPEAGLEFRAVPDGYRQGLITAITVLLGFSLSFLRFWGFEAPGQWTLRSVISTGTTMAAIVLQLIALFRSLRLEDQDAIEYQRTVRWFIGSAIALLLGLIFSVVEFALLDQK